MATIRQNISLHGLSLASGGLLQESYADSLTAHAGGGQANALLLTAELNRVTTVATIGDSVALPSTSTMALYANGPTSSAGLTIMVINHGANAMQVFGSGTDTIDDVAAGTGVSQMAGSVTIYCCTTAGAWYSNGIGTGYFGSLPTVSSTANITAHAGGGQASATQLTTTLNQVATVATTADSVKLPASAPGLQITVTNGASNSLQLFGSGTDTVNGAAAATGVAVAGGKQAVLSCYTAGAWVGPVALA